MNTERHIPSTTGIRAQGPGYSVEVFPVSGPAASPRALRCSSGLTAGCESKPVNSGTTDKRLSRVERILLSPLSVSNSGFCWAFGDLLDGVLECIGDLVPDVNLLLEDLADE